MHAVQFTTTGGPEVLAWVEVDEPVPGPTDLVVRLAAAGLNFIDTYHRSGLYQVPLPFTPGSEGAGTVVAVGERCARFRVGDRVAWGSGGGSYAELVRVPEAVAVAVPDGVDLEKAAAVMLQGMTAHYLVRDTFPLASGQRCLIHAGAGGTGLLLIQMAHHIGAEVFTTVGSPDKAELARAAGADHTILYRDVDFGEAIEQLVGPKAIDVVYDGVGKAVFERSLEVLRVRGMMVTFGNASGPPDPIAPLRLSQLGSLFLTRPVLFHYISNRADLERRAGDVFAAMADGWLDVRIGERVPLRSAAEAHRLLEGRSTTGKVLLVP
ncbi:MAG TPA: quinone oxidoreductase [Acidimicrobiales bacterium]|nr:quinone oxidoreductase [Acidimicrobiales bacterium]